MIPESVHRKFQSANENPVERAVITRAEYEAICGDQTLDKIRAIWEKRPAAILLSFQQLMNEVLGLSTENLK